VLEELAASEGYDLERCYAYSDSATCLPMLRSVGIRHAVNPGPGAAPARPSCGWPIVDFLRSVRFKRRSLVLRTAVSGPGRGCCGPCSVREPAPGYGSLTNGAFAVALQAFVELMAMIAYYHCGGLRLGLEDSMPLGEPWVPRSARP
jgi:hypothetical protein